MKEPWTENERGLVINGETIALPHDKVQKIKDAHKAALEQAVKEATTACERGLCKGAALMSVAAQQPRGEPWTAVGKFRIDVGSKTFTPVCYDTGSRDVILNAHNATLPPRQDGPCPKCGKWFLQSDGKCPECAASEGSSGNASTETKSAFTSEAAPRHGKTAPTDLKAIVERLRKTYGNRYSQGFNDGLDALAASIEEGK